ncbi:hypothetical protein V6C32_16960 [Desulforamulus ruminis]|uniref:hypothetical protein n=1 Tax=Desulforamulus ruminis TaxID=1564 RepID=UPI002FD8C49D
MRLLKIIFLCTVFFLGTLSYSSVSFADTKEMFTIQSNIYAEINGELVLFGYGFCDNTAKHKVLTLKEAEELKNNSRFMIEVGDVRCLLRHFKLKETK